MRESCTEKKRGAKRGRIWKREKGLVRQHAGRKQKEKTQAAKEESCREEEENRGAEQKGQRGR